eukprot:4621547-Pyramimonas_sp.AAC.1
MSQNVGRCCRFSQLKASLEALRVPQKQLATVGNDGAASEAASVSTRVSLGGNAGPRSTTPFVPGYLTLSGWTS